MKNKVEFGLASEIAKRLIARFAPHCERVEVAGSLRRRSDVVGDIEIIAVPSAGLYTYLDTLLEEGKIRHRAAKCWGEKMRSFVLSTVGSNPVDIQVDLFLQPDPDTWGVNMLLRTGCAEFSHRMVTKRSEGGWCPDYYTVKNARVWDADGCALDTPEEKDVFRAWGMEVPKPEDRTVEYLPAWAEVDFWKPERKPVQARKPKMEKATQWAMPFIGSENLERMSEAVNA